MAEQLETVYSRFIALTVIGPLGSLFIGAPVAVAVAVVYGLPIHAVVLLLAIGIAAGLGVTVGFHRMLTHRSFVTFRAGEQALTLLGCVAGQSSPFFWVATHRRHHQFSDHAGDPHSPHVEHANWWGRVRRFWHSHLGWTLGYVGYDPDTVRDLRKRADLAWIDRYWFVWYLFGLALPAAIGYAIGGTAYDALIGFLWGGPLRHAITQQATYAVNSLCHVWGSRPYETGDHSRNNMLVGLLSLGEGWHNNHHACPSSARHGFRWWQPDATWCLIWLLERVGLVWKVRRPWLRTVPALAP